jgi:hypothetical protein
MAESIVKIAAIPLGASTFAGCGGPERDFSIKHFACVLIDTSLQL